MAVENIRGAIEAILFANGASVEFSRIAQALEISEKKVKEHISALIDDYEASGRGKSFITGEFPSSVGQKSDRKYHFPKSFEAGQVGLRIVKQAMTQSGTDKDAEETVEKQGIELLLIYLFITVLIMNDDISQKDANRP